MNYTTIVLIKNSGTIEILSEEIFVTSVGLTSTSGGGGGSLIHGELFALDQDDHPQYLTDARGDAKYAKTEHGHEWSDITDPPTSFPPGAHFHTHADITEVGENDHHPRLHDLSSHTGVDAANPKEGQRLAWNEATQAWIPRTSASALGFLIFHYKFATAPNTNPASGYVSRDDVNEILTSKLFISSTNVDGAEQDAYWNEIKEHDWFNIYDETDSLNHASYNVSGPAINRGTYWEVPVAYFLHEGVSLANDLPVSIVWRISARYPHDVLIERDQAGSHPATAISFDNVASGLLATNSQTAIEELDTNIDDHLLDLANPHQVGYEDLGTSKLHASSHETGGNDAIDHDQLPGSGNYSHGNIDDHIANIGEPHHTRVHDHTDPLDGTVLHQSLGSRDGVGRHAATSISYSGASAGLGATEVQGAIDELDADLDAHLVSSLHHDQTHLLYGPDHTDVDSVPVVEIRHILGSRVSDQKFQPEFRMNWRGLYLSQTYYKHDVTRSGDWTSVANKETTDNPAPQEIGAPVWGLDENTALATTNDTSVVKVTHTYTMTKAGYLKSLAIYSPVWNTNTVSRITFFDGDKYSVVDNPILTVDEWTLISARSVIVTVGAVLVLTFEIYEADAASQFSGNWNSNIDVGAPASQEFTISSVTASGTLGISHTDLDSGDRSGDLDGVAVDSICRMTETADTARNTEIIIRSIDIAPTGYTSYTYDIVGNGLAGPIRTNRACNLVIDVPITVASQYSFLASAIPPSFATLSTSLEYDGVDQGAQINTAYGININFQEATISTDWDVMAVSGDGSTGGGGDFVPDVYAGAGTSGYVPDPVSTGGLLLDDAGNWVARATTGHDHTGVYEPANTNIQAHVSNPSAIPDAHHSQQHEWNGADHLNLPATFPPAAHTHVYLDLTDTPPVFTDDSLKFLRVSADELTVEHHALTILDVPGLQDELDGKSSTYEEDGINADLVDGDMWIQTNPEEFSGVIPDSIHAVNTSAVTDYSIYFSGNIVSYALQGTWPTGMAIDTATGVLTGAWSSAGGYPNLAIVANGTYGSTASNTFEVTTTTDQLTLNNLPLKINRYAI